MSGELEIQAGPKPGYWLHYLWIMPFAGFFVSAFGIGIAAQVFTFKLGLPGAIAIFIACTLLIASCTLFYDLRKPHFILTSRSLQLGARASAQAIPFSEIESIVIGLPAQTPWWFWILRFNPEGRNAYQSLMRARETTALLRLTGGRYVALNVATGTMRNGRELMAALVHLNQEKIVGPETYTPLETKCFRLARFNTIATL